MKPGAIVRNGNAIGIFVDWYDSPKGVAHILWVGEFGDGELHPCHIKYMDLICEAG